jgi:integration host factor subunit alpha
LNRSEIKDLTRSEIIDSLSARLSLSRKDAKTILENFLEIVMTGLENGETIVLNKLGALTVNLSPARPGRNPRTGRPAAVPAKRRVTFKINPSLRADMDHGHDPAKSDQSPDGLDLANEKAHGAKAQVLDTDRASEKGESR